MWKQWIVTMWKSEYSTLYNACNAFVMPKFNSYIDFSSRAINCKLLIDISKVAAGTVIHSVDNWVQMLAEI